MPGTRPGMTKTRSVPLERGPRPLRLRLQQLRLARHRHDAQRGDAVALPPQHAEAEAVEGEALAAIGDRARLVNDEARHRGRILLRKVPAHGAIEVAERDRAG